MLIPSSAGKLAAVYIPEPLLVFGGEHLHVNPRSGLARYGPYSYSPRRSHPGQVRVGVVGSALTLTATTEWLRDAAQGISGDESNPEFPGYTSDRGFFSDLVFDSNWNDTFTQSEIKDLLALPKRRMRFEAAVALVEEKIRGIDDRDSRPDYLVIAIPDDILAKCRSVEYSDRHLGVVHRDLRRAIKAAAMKYRIPTQLLRQQTIDGRDTTPAAKIAWNFFTGLYFKAGGTPWSPHGLAPGTCYAGVGFYRALGDRETHLHTSLVQAFDEHGNGLVLRGPNFEWDQSKDGGRSPHLTQDQAASLTEMVLRRYREEMKQSPRRLVIHKTSRFWPAERAGFEDALRGKVDTFDLVALEKQSAVRLITTSKYPPLRGTRFSVADVDFLYTTGFIAALGEFHGMHVPSPIRIADHVGQDTSREELLEEILLLTKMNWNSAGFAGSFPITLRFSELVGEIMREIPADREPRPQFKFYM